MNKKLESTLAELQLTRQRYREFKEANWNHAENRLKVGSLDYFYRLFRSGVQVRQRYDRLISIFGLF